MFLNNLFPQKPFDATVDEISKTFYINDTCTTTLSEDECKNTCAWDPKSQKCIPVGLFVKDTNNAEYTLDTGSSIAALSNTYCASKDLKTHGATIVRNYGSITNVYDTPTSHPMHILGQLMQPTCSTVHIPGTPDGLIGAAPSKNTAVQPHSLMGNIPEGSRRIQIDRDAGTVCIGCNGDDEDTWERMIDLPTEVKFIALESKYGKTVLDTGSTVTSKVDDNLCLVGLEDIHYLNVDYDNSLVSYRVNDTHIDEICRKEAPSKLND